MKIYAYIPREDGTTPVGTIGVCLFERKTEAGAIRTARDRLQHEIGYKERGIVVQSYTNLYNDDTFRTIYEGK